MCASPKPTIVGYVNIVPETLFNWCAFHVSMITQNVTGVKQCSEEINAV
jgi:hypothetical protein